MKRYMLILLWAMVALLVVLPVVMAEAMPGELPFNPANPVELLDERVLATFGGMVALTMLLAEGIKRIFMKKAGIDKARIMVFVVAAVIAVVAKLIGETGFAWSDILILPGNAIGVWLSATKLYERFFGTATTPAGPAN